MLRVNLDGEWEIRTDILEINTQHYKDEKEDTNLNSVLFEPIKKKKFFQQVKKLELSLKDQEDIEKKATIQFFKEAGG